MQTIQENILEGCQQSPQCPKTCQQVITCGKFWPTTFVWRGLPKAGHKKSWLWSAIWTGRMCLLLSVRVGMCLCPILSVLLLRWTWPLGFCLRHPRDQSGIPRFTWNARWARPASTAPMSFRFLTGWWRFAAPNCTTRLCSATQIASLKRNRDGGRKNTSRPEWPSAHDSDRAQRTESGCCH